MTKKLSPIQSDDDTNIRMTVNVPKDLHQKFKGITAMEGSNITDTILSFIKNYVSERERMKAKSKN